MLRDTRCTSLHLNSRVFVESIHQLMPDVNAIYCYRYIFICTMVQIVSGFLSYLYIIFCRCIVLRKFIFGFPMQLLESITVMLCLFSID